MATATDAGAAPVYQFSAASHGGAFHVLSGGGGGWGAPSERDPAARAKDAAEGLTR